MEWFIESDINNKFKITLKNKEIIIGKLLHIGNINIVDSQGKEIRFLNELIEKVEKINDQNALIRKNRGIAKKYPGIRIVKKANQNNKDSNNITQIKNSKLNSNINNNNKEDFQTIARNITMNWKLDAKQENSKYFYNIKEAQHILEGSKSYVIGRKGSGKTAICEYLLNYQSYNIFSEKLSFKNFPFNTLYELENKKYREPNQYITIWKYLIYSNVCKLMAQNEAIDKNIRDDLSLVYPMEGNRNLGRTISRWTSAEFGATIFGNGGNIKLSRTIEENNLSWIEKVNILEDFIVKHADSSKYFIVFDELDEDYGDIKEQNKHREYKNLLTSLFKAVQDVRSIFNQEDIYIFPVVFLRDDIYRFLHDADKNKWKDFEIEIEWNSSKLKNLLAFRLSRDVPNLKEPLKFNQIWNRLFTQSTIATGRNNRKKRNAFDFITDSTQLRPRDYIRYITVCAETSLEKQEEIISIDTIKYADRGFSNYLKDEIRDEIYPILPDIDQIFQIITTIRKPIFSLQEFKNEYDKKLTNGSITEKNLDYILETLFNFSIIGNQHFSQETRTFFKYKQTNMNINKSEKFVVHRGLLKSLQIY